MTRLCINQLHPRLIVMIGICAGDPRKCHLGDIIVAKTTFSYDKNAKEEIEKDDKGLEHKVLRYNTKTYTVFDSIASRVSDFIDHQKVMIDDVISLWDGNLATDCKQENLNCKCTGLIIVYKGIRKKGETLRGIPLARRMEIAHKIAVNTNWRLLGPYFEIAIGIAIQKENLVANHGQLPDAQLCEHLVEEFANRALSIHSFRRVLELPNIGMNYIVNEFSELQK